jgi:hypothetical protein
MSEDLSDLDAELIELAEKLDRYAEKLTNVIDDSVPCWIICKENEGCPREFDCDRDIACWARIESQISQLCRNVWLYQDDFTKTLQLNGTLEKLGADLAALGEDAKSVVYVDWCKHLLPNRNDRISYALEALFPQPNFLEASTPHHQRAEYLKHVKFKWTF